MPKYSSFDESFLQGLYYAIEQNRKQDEFNQQFKFQERQADFLNDHRNSIVEIQKQQESRLQQGQDMTREAQEYGIRNDYEQVPSSNLINQTGTSGTELNKQFNDVFSPFEDKKFYQPKTTPGKPITQSRLVPGSQMGIPGFEGMIEQKYQVDAKGNEIITEHEGDFGRFTPEESGGNKTTSTYKEGKLSERGAKALGYFTVPNIDEPNFFQSVSPFSKGGEDYDTPEKVQQDIADNMAALAKDIVSSDTYKFIRNIFDTDGYISPKKLKEKALNTEGLTEQQANEIVTFLNYYDTMYDGIQKLEEYIK